MFKNMDKRVQAILGIVVFAGLIGAAHIIVSLDLIPAEDLIIIHDESEEAPPLPPAPDIMILNEDGDEVYLSTLLGRPVVLNFWATWCPSCGRESPYFEKMYHELGSEFELLKVVLLDGRRETQTTVDAFMTENNYTFPLHFDKTGDASRAYNVRFIPMTFFINSEGYIAATIQGPASETTLRSGIEAII